MCYNYRMEITRKTLDHLASLSDFTLSDSEAESLKTDLENILNYVSQLDELDVSGVEPTYQVFEMENITRPDEILPQDADREGLLGLSAEVYDNQIKVPKVL